MRIFSRLPQTDHSLWLLTLLLPLFLLPSCSSWFHRPETVTSIVEKYGPDATTRLTPYFTAAQIHFPPEQITLLAIKDEKRLELWANAGTSFAKIRNYPILAASGSAGPKMREGDYQVPEGIYTIEGFNPNSQYHLSLKLNYPNTFDLRYAQLEGRFNPGSNIFIHGKNLSAGCLAIGDEPIEELFLLVHYVGRSNCKVIIAPSDPRKGPLFIPPRLINKSWVHALYAHITAAFAPYSSIRVGPQEEWQQQSVRRPALY